MHSVFRVVEMNQTAKNNRLWEVQLTITDDNDPQLSALTNRIKEEVKGSNGWYRMGKLMLQVGHFDQAEELYQELLKNASTDSDREHIYRQLGCVNECQGEYEEAALNLNNFLGIYLKTLHEDHSSLTDFYNSMSTVYVNMGEYLKAVEFHEKSIKIREISLPPNHPDLAISYNNIGSVYDSMDECSKALSYLEKALSIFRNSLPSTHPHIKSVMNSIEEVKKKL
ncbi:unnamed protein product [Rotaria magnacalcarata]|uniref:Kinesin light chain n=1 Tax=Rotaria magnacalcarata TaxID=392030 RepID=A0A816BVW7_9BILA|nr:unnamed protein product [Rotaria magnacalcarata]